MLLANSRNRCFGAPPTAAGLPRAQDTLASADLDAQIFEPLPGGIGKVLGERPENARPEILQVDSVGQES